MGAGIKHRRAVGAKGGLRKVTRRQVITMAVYPAGLPMAHGVEDTPRDFMLQRLNRFNETMQDLVSQLRQHRFDLREARLLSKLWRDVEQSGEWPRD